MPRTKQSPTHLSRTAPASSARPRASGTTSARWQSPSVSDDADERGAARKPTQHADLSSPDARVAHYERLVAETLAAPHGEAHPHTAGCTRR